MRNLIFVDTETTGFDDNPDAEVFELSYAPLTGDVKTLFFGVEEVPQIVDDLTKFTERGISGYLSPESEFTEFAQVAKDNTMVAANPAFDKLFIRRAGLFNFHYRMLDIESYAMKALGLSFVPGMHDIFKALTEMGFTLPEPDHTSRGDVLAMRQAFQILRRLPSPPRNFKSL